MTLTGYTVFWSEHARMWAVADEVKFDCVGHFEYASDAENHAMDLEALDRFEEDMAALRGEEF